MSDKLSIAELERLQTILEAQYTEESEQLSDLVSTELYRRRRAGRPSKGLTRREQNRRNQATFRANKALKDKQK